jgi:hypothetical protein
MVGNHAQRLRHRKVEMAQSGYACDRHHAIYACNSVW